MTAPPEIRRRLSESLAHLASARAMWEAANEDHALDLEEIQADCPHENVSGFSGQYGCETLCVDCGKILESY